jgi:single-stranded DNA-binding protein
MSSSTISRTIVFGRLGADPTFKVIGHNAVALNFKLATDHTFMRNGEQTEHTEWHTVKTVITKAQEPMFRDRLKKGRKVLVEGPRITDTVLNTDGSKQFYSAIRAYPEDIVLPDPEARTPNDQMVDEGAGYEAPLRREQAQKPAVTRPVSRDAPRAPVHRPVSANVTDALDFD